MGSYPPPPPGPGVGQRIEEAFELIEMELRHAVAYVNDAGVPQVRQESIRAMRNLSETLRWLADKFYGTFLRGLGKSARNSNATQPMR